MIVKMRVWQVIEYLSQFDEDKQIRCIASDFEDEVEGQLYLNSFDGDEDIEIDVRLDDSCEIVCREEQNNDS